MTQPDSEKTSLKYPALTARKRNILAFIEASTKKNGYPPSLREIGEATQLESTSSVVHHIRSLVSRDPD
ncbi:hypothetical protein [Streptomyces sp. NPDC102462]|uniref:LexA family protein n=1 Tax=Streptomyces sp. NPDC102462 TaxID=3366178 RepID=UPI00380997AF